MPRHPHRFIALLALACLGVHRSPAAAQVATSDAAQQFAGIPVPNLDPSFTWLDDHSLLSRLDGEGGAVEFRVTDARTGTHRPALDSRKLAKVLAQHLGRAVEASSLPITRVGVADGRLIALVEPEFRAFEITQDGEGASPMPLEEASPFLVPTGRRDVPGSGRTSVQLVNRLASEVRIFWLSGGRRHPYGTLAPGESRRQGTVVGHAWIAVDDEQREYGVFVAEEAPAIVLIHPGSRRTDRDTRDTSPPAGDDPRDWDALVEDHNVVLRHRTTNATRQITFDGSPDDYFRDTLYWSPDGTKLLATRTRPAEPRTVHIVESSPRDQRQPKLRSFAYRKPGDDIDHHRPVLVSIDPASGEAEAVEIADELFAKPWSPFGDVTWRTDGSEVIVSYIERGHRIARIIGINAASGDARVLIDEAPATFFDYAHKMHFEPIREMREAVWMSERSGWNHLHRFDLATGEHLGPITSGAWVVRGVERVDHEREEIWFRAMGVFPDQDPYHVHFGRVGFDGDGLTWLTRANGTHSVRYSPGGDYLVARHSRADLAPVHELRRATDGSLIAELSRAQTSPLASAGWRPPEVFCAKGRDGRTDIWGLIFTPTDFSPDKSYPVVEQIYAGPHGHHVPKAFSRWHRGARELAELGFVVVQIDGMGTNWRSKAFHDVAWKNLADAGFPDRIAWMRQAAATRPWMDLQRVGIFGGSAGGQNAMAALLHHNDFYRVAVADCGCHDNRMDKVWWNELWMGWPIDEAAYDASSNVVHAGKLDGELLLIVGELDSNVDPASTMQVVDALIRADKDFDMLVIPGVGHGAGGSPYGRRRTLDFLVEHLKTR